MKTPKFILSLVILTLSCSSDVNIDFPNNFPLGNNCLSGQGSIASETRILGEFHSIVSTIFADILISQGPEEDVIVEAQQNILNELKTEVVNGELRLTLNRCINIHQALKVYITIPEIRSLALKGVGDIIAQNNFNLTNLNLTLTGVGNFILQGTSTTLNIISTGVGNVNAFALNSDVCDVKITGVGNIEVFVNDELNVTTSGSGSVFYKGNPSITSIITGTGGVVDAN